MNDVGIFIFNYIFYKVIYSFISIRITICKLYRGILLVIIVFNEVVCESDLEVILISLGIIITDIWNTSTTSMPLGLILVTLILKVINDIEMGMMLLFFNLSVAYFHPLIIKTCSFSKSRNYKINLTFKAFNPKIKPSTAAIRVYLFLCFYNVSIVRSF